MTLKQPLSFNESRKTGEFIVWEPNRNFSRDTGVLEIGHALQDGTVLKFVSHTDGEELAPLSASDFDTGGLKTSVVIAGILLGPHDSSNDTIGVNAAITGVPYIARVAAVNAAVLQYFTGISTPEIADITAALAKALIVSR